MRELTRNILLAYIRANPALTESEINQIGATIDFYVSSNHIESSATNKRGFTVSQDFKLLKSIFCFLVGDDAN
jgi:hypothetical protein